MSTSDLSHPGKSDTAVAETSKGHPRWRVAAYCGAMLGALVIAHLWYDGARVDATVYSADDLQNGTICQIIPWEGGRTAVQVSYVSDMPADKFWHIVTHHHAYPDLMPGVQITSEHDNGDGTSSVDQVLSLPHVDYELKLKVWVEQEGRVRRWKWRQTSGPLDADDGAFVVEDLGNRTILRYQVSACVPGCPQWLVDYTLRRRHADLFEVMERHARSGKAVGGGHSGS